MNTLTFNEVNFNPVERNGQIWLTSTEIAKALGYARTDNISRIYNRNKDEFTDTMTTTINMVVKGFGGGEGNKRDVRIFSLRGCHLLAMLARTEIAKRFRKWVLDILDKEVGATVQASPNHLTADQTLDLRQAVSILVTKSGILYPDVYKMVHQKFGVNHIKELTLTQMSQAIEYIHELTISASIKESPLSSFTHNQYIVGVKHEIMDYVHLLRKMVVAGGNTLPKYPELDAEAICQAFIVSMIQHNRMLLSFDHNGKPVVGFVPQEHAVVSRESISSVVHFADKSQLPSIINEAVKRLGK